MKPPPATERDLTPEEIARAASDIAMILEREPQLNDYGFGVVRVQEDASGAGRYFRARQGFDPHAQITGSIHGGTPMVAAVRQDQGIQRQGNEL